MSYIRALEESWGLGPRPITAAKVIAPLLIEVLRPASVIDVGCGGGGLVRELRNLGVMARGFDRQKVEGMEFVDLTGKIHLLPAADVAVCLEVAEHLKREHAERLVESLVRAAPIVVFAAGIPLQGGWHHVNEQWPSWWAALFARWRYVPHEDLRLDLWQRHNIAPWYAQDMLIYCREGQTGLRRATLLDVVHPRSWTRIGPMGVWQRIKGWKRRNEYGRLAMSQEPT
jgi:SAM-dependent methyltransferase